MPRTFGGFRLCYERTMDVSGRGCGERLNCQAMYPSPVAPTDGRSFWASPDNGGRGMSSAFMAQRIGYSS